MRIALQNAQKNHIPAERYTAEAGNIIDDEALRARIGTGYRVVTANIVADVLIAMSPYFSGFMAGNGVVIISGIILERCDEVMQAMENAGLTRVAMRTSDGWAAAAFKR